MYKVHWIIDGIANVNEKTQEDAENVIKTIINKDRYLLLSIIMRYN